jgi:hypothetical protein
MVVAEQRVRRRGGKDSGLDCAKHPAADNDANGMTIEPELNTGY